MDQKIVITGAAGRIGSSLAKDFDESTELVLADKDMEKLKELNGENRTLFELDILDKASCLDVCKGADTVVHLAANPSPESSF
ncbi:MAG: NAD-dependent epimerase/dehydratase family protein, partial [Alkalibacterium sp.]